MTRLRGAMLLMLAATPALADDPPATKTPSPATDAAPAPDPDACEPDPCEPGTAPQAAEAEPQAPTFEVKSRTYTTVTTETRKPGFGSYGFAFSAGGGVSGFTSDTARSTTNDGGGWDVRAVIGVNATIAGEVAYIGSAQGIDSLGLESDAVLVGNGAQANLRLNLTTATALQPFLYAGAAWRHYELANTPTNTSDIADTDNVIEIPVGVGVAFRYKGLIVDARGEFRPTTGEDLMPSLTGDPFVADSEASLHRWGITATVGVEL